MFSLPTRSQVQRALLALCILILSEYQATAQQYDGGYPQQRRKKSTIQVGRQSTRALSLAKIVGGVFGMMLGCWGIRSHHGKLKQKYSKELKAQERRLEDSLQVWVDHYQGTLRKKQEDYVEKVKHLQYIENAMAEAGIHVDGQAVTQAAAQGMYTDGDYPDLMQNDYAEFKEPDTNNDGRISRKEFDKYMRTHLRKNPEYSKSDYPSFDEFDKDKDGSISFREWRDYVQEAETAALQEQLQPGIGRAGLRL